MKLTVLTENTVSVPELKSVHGLSVHLETGGHQIMMDVGPGREFLENARVLGVDISRVELCAISHGHNDHGGGLGLFLEHNDRAEVYLSDLAFEDYYSGTKYIGLDKSLSGNRRLHRVVETAAPVEGVTLLGRIPGDILLPAANGNLLEAEGADRFLHEIVMLVEEGDYLLLLGGCAHRGIVNILEYVKRVVGRYPDGVVSGLHISAGPSGILKADEEYLDALAEKLLATGAMFYSCHCTGEEGLIKLKQRMGDRLTAVSAGTVLNLK